MKTTFAAACLAASTTAFDLLAVPEFVAGMVYGLSGENHLSEIQSCYKSGESVVTDSEAALSDFKSGHYFKGIKELGVTWNAAFSALHTCEGMHEDIAEIEAWAKIFTEPVTLSKTVAKNWIFHGA